MKSGVHADKGHALMRRKGFVHADGMEWGRRCRLFFGWVRLGNVIIANFPFYGIIIFIIVFIRGKDEKNFAVNKA